MDGITVLKTYDALVSSTWGWSWPGLIIALIVLGGVIALVWGAFKIKDYSLIIPTIFLLVVGGFISAIVFGSATPIYEPRQDVYIHGTVNMDEFNEKYQIIKQDGLIYTITENVTE